MAARYCTRCGQAIPPNATSCPQCQTPVPVSPATATSSPAAAAPATGGAPPAQGSGPARRACGNCRSAMRWIGHYSLRASGTPGAVPGVSTEGAETLLPFSLYYCQTCGKFDFYYPGT